LELRPLGVKSIAAELLSFYLIALSSLFFYSIDIVPVALSAAEMRNKCRKIRIFFISQDKSTRPVFHAKALKPRP
jgi:hypothetical protein